MSRKNGNNNSVEDIGVRSGHLWEPVNILRGSVDAADFTTCILPLLLFKRLSDANNEPAASGKTR